MDRKLGFGIIGGGMISQYHAKAISSLEAIRNNTEPPLSPEEGRYTLAVIKAIYESARTGKPVKVDEIMKG
jgi:predicted dehydrogenase